MCVIDWKRTWGSPMECSRRCSKLRCGVAVVPNANLLCGCLPSRTHHRALTGRIAHALLDPGVPAVKDGQRRGVAGVVLVGPQRVEEAVRPPPRLAAEQVGQLA